MKPIARSAVDGLGRAAVAAVVAMVMTTLSLVGVWALTQRVAADDPEHQPDSSVVSVPSLHHRKRPSRSQSTPPPSKLRHRRPPPLPRLPLQLQPRPNLRDSPQALRPEPSRSAQSARSPQSAAYRHPDSNRPRRTSRSRRPPPVSRLGLHRSIRLLPSAAGSKAMSPCDFGSTSAAGSPRRSWSKPSPPGCSMLRPNSLRAATVSHLHGLATNRSCPRSSKRSASSSTDDCTRTLAASRWERRGHATRGVVSFDNATTST